MAEKEKNDAFLKEKAIEIRRLVIKMVSAAKCGHPGGPLGLADIYAVLFFEIMKHKAENPLWEDRDRLVLSNGHVSAVLYATMYLANYFQEYDIMKFRKLASPFQGHPSTKYLPMITNSSGSLGQGLSFATGLALGAKLQQKQYQVYVCLSDGECGEGMTWEAATAAVHHGAPIIAFLDNNGIQIDGKTKDVCDLGDLSNKFSSFGWEVQEIDGHNIAKIRGAFREAKENLEKEKQKEKQRPQMIVCNTILGKGVSFMEDKYSWHGKAPNKEETEAALKELKKPK